MSDYRQICHTINIGLVVIDRQLEVRMWNRWMAYHTGIREEEIVGRSLMVFFPEIDLPKFNRFVKSVFTFGNYSIFSQKLHNYLFPVKNPHSSKETIPWMQQNCTAGPIRDMDGNISTIFISVEDVTDYVAYERRLVELGKTDYLTGVHNRSHLEKRLEEEMARARRYGHRLGILMIDVDHFKSVNDSRGHLCGDKALRHVAAVCRRFLRSTDFIGRYGGEEFCCILPETDSASARSLADRLRGAVENDLIEWEGESFSVTVSIGAAEMSDSDDTLEKLVKRADEALYKAKEAGRNRVVSASCSNILTSSPESSR